MTDFELALKTAAEKSILKIISEGAWIENRYDNRYRLPAELLADVYKLVDAEKIKAAFAKRLEEELADRIVNRLAEEISTDIKQILSVKEQRESIREVARQHLMKVTSND